MHDKALDKENANSVVELLERAVRSRIDTYSYGIMPIIHYFLPSRRARMLSVFMTGMLTLTQQVYKEVYMSDADNATLELRKKLVLNNIDSLVILARQRGLPIDGFSRASLEPLSIVDLKEIHDGLRELVYAPPAR